MCSARNVTSSFVCLHSRVTTVQQSNECVVFVDSSYSDRRVSSAYAATSNSNNNVIKSKLKTAATHMRFFCVDGAASPAAPCGDEVDAALSGTAATA